MVRQLWNRARFWRYVAVAAIALAMGGWTTADAAGALQMVEIAYNGVVAKIDGSGNLAVKDSAANAALGTANASLANMETRLNSTVDIAGHGRVVYLQTTDFTMSEPNGSSHEWDLGVLDDCRSWTAYLFASDALTVRFAPSNFAQLPGTEIGGADVVATDGSHFSGWMALQDNVPVTAPGGGLILELQGSESSVTVHTLYLYCSR